MVFSTDGGTNWTNDPELDTLMTANGDVPCTGTSVAPSTNRGGAGAAFQGYPQPSLLAYDPENGNFLVAGGIDSGIFLSVDNGTNWSLVTRPERGRQATSAPAARRVLRPRAGHPARHLRLHPGPRRLAAHLPAADRRCRRPVRRRTKGTDVVLDASGSTDPDGGPLTYAWDFDNDGQYDDATGVSPTFTLVGQDGVFPISVKATDPDGGYDTDSGTVTVNNVAPTRREPGLERPEGRELGDHGHRRDQGCRLAREPDRNGGLGRRDCRRRTSRAACSRTSGRMRR